VRLLPPVPTPKAIIGYQHPLSISDLSCASHTLEQIPISRDQFR
jgi:hypothetical protein